VVRQIQLSDSRFSLKRDSSGTNLSFILDYFRPDSVSGPPSSKKITWNIDELVLDSVSLSYQYTGVPPKAGVVNFSDIELSDVSGRFSEINFTDHVFKSNIRELQLHEKSGFEIREMNALAVVDADRLELKALDVKTNRSHIRDYMLLEYPDFSAFDDFIHQVAITLTLNHARINSEDIAFFAPKVNVTNFDVRLSGSFAGRIPDLSAHDVVLQTGQHTRLSGDITINGL